MITKMEIFSAQPDAPELTLGGFSPNLDPVQIRDIQGLGPVKAALLSTQFASGKGELYQGSSVGKRNIVITLGLDPNWEDQTVSSLRQLLYGYFMPEAWTKLRFFSDEMPTTDIEGYVESFEPNMFSDDPEIQISIICPKPDFIEADATIYYGIVDDGSAQLEIEYAGTVNTGFELAIHSSADNVSYVGPLDIGMQQEPSDPVLFSIDPVTINGTNSFKLTTIQNRKRAIRLEHAPPAADVTVNLLAYVADDSEWPQIKPGMNLFTVEAAETGQIWTLAYFNRYGGL